MPFLRTLIILSLLVPFAQPWAFATVSTESAFFERFLSPRSEQRLVQRLHALSRARGGPSNPYLRGKPILELTLEEACREALRGNFDLELARLDHRIAAREVTARQATFDPVFDVSLEYRKADAYERFEDIERERRREVDWEAFDAAFTKRAEVDDVSELTDEEDTDCLGCSPCIYVDGVLINPWECQSKYHVSVEREYASLTRKHGAIPDVWTLMLRASKAFSWGQAVDLTLETMNRANPYPSLGPYAALYTYDEGVAEFPFGDNPWSSSLSLNASTPLPFCKGFGAYGSIDHVDSLLAEARTRALAWRVRDMERLLTERVHEAYWDLVAALTRLDILMDARSTLEDMAARTLRLFEWGYKTAYDKAQGEAELLSLENRQEIAWRDLVIHSNRLAELLGLEGDVMLLPIHYTWTLKRSLDAEGSPSIPDAVSRRPDLKVLRSEHEAVEVRHRYRKNQVRPDLVLSCSLGLSQTDTLWGFSSLRDSWEHLAEPDNQHYFVGLILRWPLGNRAARSALRSSESALRKSKKTVKNTINHIVNEIKTSQSAIRTSKNMVLYADDRFEKSALTYQKALHMRENDDQISDFELLNVHHEMIQSKLTVLDALITHQKSRAALLSAGGALSGSGAGLEGPRPGASATETRPLRGDPDLPEASAP